MYLLLLCLEYIKATPNSLLHSLRSKFCCNLTSKMIYHRGRAWGSMHLEVQFVTWSWSLVQTCVVVVASLTREMVAYHAYGTADSDKSCCYSWFVCHDKTAAPMSIFMHSPYLKRTQLLCMIWRYRLWAASLCLSWFGWYFMYRSLEYVIFTSCNILRRVYIILYCALKMSYIYNTVLRVKDVVYI